MFKFCFSDSFLLTLEQFENLVSKERNAEKESKNFFIYFRFWYEQSSQMFTTNPFLVLVHGAAFCLNNPPPSQSACFSKVQGTECSGFYISDNVVEIGMDLVF